MYNFFTILVHSIKFASTILIRFIPKNGKHKILWYFGCIVNLVIIGYLSWVNISKSAAVSELEQQRVLHSMKIKGLEERFIAK